MKIKELLILLKTTGVTIGIFIAVAFYFYLLTLLDDLLSKYFPYSDLLAFICSAAFIYVWMIVYKHLKDKES